MVGDFGFPTVGAFFNITRCVGFVRTGRGPHVTRTLFLWPSLFLPCPFNRHQLHHLLDSEIVFGGLRVTAAGTVDVGEGVIAHEGDLHEFLDGVFFAEEGG